MSIDKLVDSSQLDADLTAVADAIRTKGGTSGSLAFPAGFVSAVQAIPSGGSGATEITSGTFTGSGSNYTTFPIGTKMAQTDFIVTVIIDEAAREQPYNSSYKIVSGCVICDSEHSAFDLSENGNHYAEPVNSFSVNNSGTITALTDDGLCGCGHYLRNATIGEVTIQSNYTMISKSATGFSLRLRFGTGSFTTDTYHYRILYYGDSPETDIVEV